MSVESFDPGADTPGLTIEVIAELLAATEALDEPGFGLPKDRIGALAVAARHDAACDWAAASDSLDTVQLLALIRFYTLAERLPGWEAGARSPVIPMVAELKKRGEYPADLGAWIKERTDNRFLPYGSLLDRL